MNTLLVDIFISVGIITLGIEMIRRILSSGDKIGKGKPKRRPKQKRKNKDMYPETYPYPRAKQLVDMNIGEIGYTQHWRIYDPDAKVHDRIYGSADTKVRMTENGLVYVGTPDINCDGANCCSQYPECPKHDWIAPRVREGTRAAPDSWYHYPNGELRPVDKRKA